MNNNNLRFNEKQYTKGKASTVAKTSELNPKDDERLIDLEEVATRLGGISTRSVRRLIARGDLPKPVKVLSSSRLYNSDVTSYLEGLKEQRSRKS